MKLFEQFFRHHNTHFSTWCRNFTLLASESEIPVVSVLRQKVKNWIRYLKLDLPSTQKTKQPFMALSLDFNQNHTKSSSYWSWDALGKKTAEVGVTSSSLLYMLIFWGSCVRFLRLQQRLRTSGTTSKMSFSEERQRLLISWVDDALSPADNASLRVTTRMMNPHKKRVILRGDPNNDFYGLIYVEETLWERTAIYW